MLCERIVRGPGESAIATFTFHNNVIVFSLTAESLLRFRRHTVNFVHEVLRKDFA